MSQRKATVCQLLHSLSLGGAEVLASRFARCLSASYRFVFVCLDELGALGAQLRDEGFPVHVLSKREGVDWRCVCRLARVFRHERVDLIHAHQYPAFFYGITARLAARRPAVLFTEHGRHHPDYPRRKRILLNRLLLERRDRVVGVGQAVCRALVTNEGFPEGRVGVIYNGIPLRPLPDPETARAAVRRELRLDSPAVVVLQVARLDPLKDHATAVRALRGALTSGADLQLVLAGDGPALPALRELAFAAGLGDRVHFLGQRPDVPRLLAAADVVLLTSLSEGIPLAVIEGMAAGLPVVATCVGGVPEVVVDGQTGLLAPAGDDGRLGGHLVGLARDPARRARMGQLGRERAVAAFSEDRMHAAYCQLYEEMLPAKRRRPVLAR